METLEIKYVLELGTGSTQIFDLRFDARRLELIRGAVTDLPEWTRLEFCQCPHCPLDFEYNPHCPLAASLSEVVDRFKAVISHDQIELTVITAERRVFAKTTVQKALSSLLGLMFPASGCPHTAFFRPMVRFHLPLASDEATLFRATGMYLLAQYFITKQGGTGDGELEGLKELYSNLHILNTHMAERIRSAVSRDSSVNAIILLDVYTHTMPFAIEDQLAEIRYLFAPYFNNCGSV